MPGDSPRAGTRGRPERPLNPDDGPVAAFALQLRALRQAVGNPTYREMAEKAHYSYSGLANAASGKKLPSWSCTRAYLTACGVVDNWAVAPWQRRWQAAQDHVRDLKEQQAALLAEFTTDGDTPPPAVSYRDADLSAPA